MSRLFACNPYGSTAARVHRPASDTRKPKTLTVDIHCHILNEDAENLARSIKPITEESWVVFADDDTRKINMKQALDRKEEFFGVEQRLKDMDAMMIDIQVLSPGAGQFFYWAEPDLAQELCRLQNDHVAETVAANPDRFTGMSTLPLQHTQLAIEELERCHNELGIRAAIIGPEIEGEELSVPRLEKFWSRCDDLGTILFVHPMGYPQSDRFSKHYLTNIVANPLATTVAVHHLIFDGVMERHPGLKIVLAHGGGFVSHYNGRMDHAYGARPDCCKHISKPPTHYLKKFYFDAVVFTPHQLEYLATLYGTDHLLLGSDYPFDMGEYDPIELIDQIATFSDDDKANIWGLNAARLLGLRT